MAHEARHFVNDAALLFWATIQQQFQKSCLILPVVAAKQRSKTNAMNK